MVEPLSRVQGVRPLNIERERMRGSEARACEHTRRRAIQVTGITGVHEGGGRRYYYA